MHLHLPLMMRVVGYLFKDQASECRQGGRGQPLPHHAILSIRPTHVILSANFFSAIAPEFLFDAPSSGL
jgi:hypothetical protein